MVDLSEYQHVGDLTAPFEHTKKHERMQREREQMRDSVHCDVPPLSWQAYVDGEPCPGCGMPYRDEEPWVFRGTMHMSPAETERYEAEQAAFAARHPDCHSLRHSVSVSLTTHCGKCCPSPPLSPAQVEDLGRLLNRAPTPDHQLMRWRLRFFCGHVVEKRSHISHKAVHSAFMGSSSCAECGLDPATIIDAEPLGPVAQTPKPATAAAPRKPTRAQLEARVHELESELARLRDDS